jgi:hypothetical protein
MSQAYVTLLCLGPLVFLSQRLLNLCLSNILSLSVHDEGYFQKRIVRTTLDICVLII